MIRDKGDAQGKIGSGWTGEIVTGKTSSRADDDLSAQRERERQLFLTIRQAHIMMLGAIEDYLGMERSIVPKHTKR